MEGFAQRKTAMIEKCFLSAGIFLGAGRIDAEGLDEDSTIAWDSIHSSSWTEDAPSGGAGDDACCDSVISDGGFSCACG